MNLDPGSAAAMTGAKAPKTSLELRRFLRRKLSASGSLRFGGQGYRVRVEDISEQGCQFWIPRRHGLPLGTSIALYIEEVGPFPATVRWSRDGWIGIQFDFPVYPPVLAHMCESHAADE